MFSIRLHNIEALKNFKLDVKNNTKLENFLVKWFYNQYHARINFKHTCA